MQITRRELVRVGIATGSGLVLASGAEEAAASLGTPYNLTVQRALVTTNGDGITYLTVMFSNSEGIQIQADPVAIQDYVSFHIPAPDRHEILKAVVLGAYLDQDPTLSNPQLLVGRQVTWDPTRPNQLMRLK